MEIDPVIVDVLLTIIADRFSDTIATIIDLSFMKPLATSPFHKNKGTDKVRLN